MPIVRRRKRVPYVRLTKQTLESIRQCERKIATEQVRRRQVHQIWKVGSYWLAVSGLGDEGASWELSDTMDQALGVARRAELRSLS